MLRIRELRKARGLTQQQLADMVGVLNVSLSNYERGTQTPDIFTLMKIADALGVSLDNLMGLDERAGKNSAPHTSEARILANGIDKLPKDQRELAVNVVKTIFAQYSDYFNEGESTND